MNYENTSKKIVLVNPQIITSNWSADFKSSDDIVIRHGLAYLSASLKADGHNVFLLDLRLLKDWNDYEQHLKKINPDFLGVTMHTCEWNLALEACKRAKKINKNIITVIGGIQATMFAEEATKKDFIDFVLRGEGEISFPKLVQNPGSFPKIFWGETPDLDKIPFEDRELWPDYKKRIQCKIIGFNAPTPVVDMLTKRGCPWQCKFCCGPGEQNLYTREADGKRIPFVRARSVKNVMEEMRMLYQKYQYRSIIFHDDEFLIDPKWTEDFCKAMHDYGFVGKKIKWWAAVRADMICRFPELIKQMKEAGLETISIGFESFSDRLLKWMNKGTTAELNFKAAKIAKKLNLKIFANTIFGLPYEDGKWYLKDDLLTLKAMKKIKPDVWPYSYFTPIPGSAFYDWFKKNNLILVDSPEMSGLRIANKAKIKNVDYQQLEKLITECRYRVFQSLPKRMIKRTLKIIGLWNFIKKYSKSILNNGKQ
jgi:radical SAM superfamily enzyme YgiQ (UPF0313 family)